MRLQAEFIILFTLHAISCQICMAQNLDKQSNQHLINGSSLIDDWLNQIAIYSLSLQDTCTESECAKYQNETKNNHTDAETIQTNQDKILETPLDTRLEEASLSRFKYIDELSQDKFQYLTNENTFDERLANILYTASSLRPANADWFVYNSGDKKRDLINEKLSAGPQADDVICGRHLEEILTEIENISQKVEQIRNETLSGLESRIKFNEKHHRLARVLDAFGHYESGYFSGRTHSLGSWEQCVETQFLLRSQHNHRQQALVDSRFCWAKLSLRKNLNKGLANLKQSTFESKGDRFHLGICIPATCHSRGFEQNRPAFERLIRGQFKFPSSIYVDHSPQIESIYCGVDEGTQFYKIPLSGKLFLALCLAWIALTVYASYERSGSVDKKEDDRELRNIKPSKWSSVLECLDVRESWNDLMGVNEPDRSGGRVNLDVLNVIRCFGCAFVVCGHAMLIRGYTSQDMIRNSRILDYEPLGSMMILGTNVVDTFFTITGILLAYATMKRSKRMQKSGSLSNDQTSTCHLEQVANSTRQVKTPIMQQFLAGCRKLIERRYFRLMPLFAIVFYFKKSVLLRLGSGPYWDHGFNRDTFYGSCHEESWLSPFFINSAFKPLTGQCILPSWTVSCDIVFTIVLAPILLIMTKKPKLAALMGAALCLISCILTLDELKRFEPDVLSMLSDIRIISYGFFSHSMSYYYALPYFRISSVILGSFAGYYLYLFDENKLTNLDWPKWFKGPVTKLAFIAISLISLLTSQGSFLRSNLTPYHKILFPIFVTLGRMAWSMANAVIFMRMTTNWKDTPLMRLSSGKSLSTMSKLNYATLLVHFDLLLWDNTLTHTHITTKWTFMQSTCTAYILLAPIASFLYVVFENPLDKLTRRHLLE